MTRYHITSWDNAIEIVDHHKRLRVRLEGDELEHFKSEANDAEDEAAFIAVVDAYLEVLGSKEAE